MARDIPNDSLRDTSSSMSDRRLPLCRAAIASKGAVRNSAAEVQQNARARRVTRNCLPRLFPAVEKAPARVD